MTLTRARLFHPHTGAPIETLGHRKDGRPIMPILGAGPDDDMDEDIDDEGDEEGDEDENEEGDEDEGGEDEQPALREDGKPFTQKDLDALQLALRKARRDGRRARREDRNRGRDNGRDDKGGKNGKDGENKDGDAPDLDRIRLEAEDSATARWKPLLVNRIATERLREAGVVGDPKRLLRLLDHDDIEVDEDGEIDGLDEQIEDLRKEYKHLFRRRGTRRINGADKDGRESRNGGKKMTATEIQAKQLLGEL